MRLEQCCIRALLDLKNPPCSWWSETMPKPSIGSALTSSLRAEQKAADQRFSDLSRRVARADHVLQEPTEEISAPKEQVLVVRGNAGQPDISVRDSRAEEGDEAS